MLGSTTAQLLMDAASEGEGSQATVLGTIKDVLALPALIFGAAASIYVLPKARLDKRKAEIDERKAWLEARKTRLEILEKERQLGILDDIDDTSIGEDRTLRQEAESLE